MIFDKMTFSQWNLTIHSKVQSSWNLHQQLPQSLDFFILLSSLSGICGNVSQSNYAAGCTFQDSLARFRLLKGLNAVAIDIGWMRDIGIVAENTLYQQIRRRERDTKEVEGTELIALLEICCEPSRPSLPLAKSQVLIGARTPADALILGEPIPPLLQRPLFSGFSQLVGGARRDVKDKDTLSSEVLFRQATRPEERTEILTKALVARLARALDISPGDVEPTKFLSDYGVDSLMAVELRNWVGKDFHAEIAVFDITGGTSIAALASLVVKRSTIKSSSQTSQSTIQRELTIDSLNSEIKQVELEAERGLPKQGVPLLMSTDMESLVSCLRDLYAQALDLEELEVDDDLFAKGLGSESTLAISIRLKELLKDYGVPKELLTNIDTELVCSTPNILDMSTRLSSLISGKSPALRSSNALELDGIITKYGAKVQNLGIRFESHDCVVLPEGRTVLLTGSTSSLGSYILSALLENTDMKVICLNRTAGARSKQVASLRSKGLPPLPTKEHRVLFLQVDLSAPKLGLSDKDYATIKDETTAIIHNAFPVNFLMPLRSFEPQFESLVNLLSLATEGAKKPAFLFVSSIAAVVLPAGGHQIVPEAVPDKFQMQESLKQGYAQAKFICEHLLQQYATISGRTTSILRFGQISGPLVGTGTWKIEEWLPSLVISSKWLCAAPDSIGQKVEWIPVDEAGKIVVDLLASSMRSKSENFTVYNIVNPSTASWDQLLPALNHVAPSILPSSEWLARLKKSRDQSSSTLEQNPGMKLEDFYKYALVKDERDVDCKIDNLLRDSKTAEELPRISREHMARWIEGWGL